MAETRPDRIKGPVHDQFWAFCAKDELQLQRCGACAHLNWPATEACAYCDSPDLTWEPVSGRGKVAAWCTIEKEFYKGVLPIPWDTILVELEEGPMFISNPQGFSWPDITPDMPVKVAFIDAEDAAGAFRLPVFAKV